MRVASVLGLDTELEAAWNCRRPVILGESGVWAGLDRDGEDYWLECASELMNGTGKGAPNKIQREAWTSYQEQLRETRVKLNKIGALAEAWEHTDHDADEREPDCAGCWSASIWAILGGES